MMKALTQLHGGAVALRPGVSAMEWAETRAARVLAGDVGGVGLPEAMHAADAGGWRPYDVRDGVACIPVMGLIVPALGWLGSPWATGCEELRWQVSEALADDEVRGVALCIDSGGGYVAGVDETAAAIRAARAVKPFAAVVESWAFSAAYWIASAAGTVSAPRTGGVGHVGVIATHFDMRGAFEQMGVAATVFTAGQRKGDGHPLLPLSERAADEIQAGIDATRRVFAESVAEGLGLSVDAVLATEARAFDGPAAIEEARSLGLVDAILSADEALRAFAAGIT